VPVPSTVTYTDDLPRDRAEAERALGAARAKDPDNADRYRLRYTTGGYVVARIDHPDDAPDPS
jgi:hypothetical protein